MLLRMLLLLATSEASLLPRNRSARRHGKEALLADLRGHNAFKYKSSPCDEDNVVSIDFKYHYQVLMVDEVEQAVSSVGYMLLMWRDPDLSWNKTEYGEVEMLNIPYNEIWHPAITVYNAVDPEYMTIDKMQSVLLISNGYLLCTSPVYLLTTCNMDLIYYPFDTQTCSIVFVIGFDDVRYNVSASALGDMDDRYTVTGEWTITSKNMSSLQQSGLFSVDTIRFTMVIERRPLFYLLCVLAPMILTASVTSVVFMIPPNSGEKISFLVTVFVSDAVFLNFIAGTMPRNMSSLPRLPLFLVLINIQCVFAMIATVFVMRKYEQEQHSMNNQLDAAMNNEKIFSQREGVAQITEPHTGSYNHCNANSAHSTYIFRKLSFRKPRVSPLEENSESETQHRTHRKGGTYSLRSTTWDMIFFFVFHTISVPCYYLLFKA